MRIVGADGNTATSDEIGDVLVRGNTATSISPISNALRSTVLSPLCLRKNAA
jgi:hypothetical protein